MKKIFLLFMILGLSLINFIDTQGATHTTYKGFDLDTQEQILGGISLRDFFETNNLVVNHDFSNGSTGWTLVNATIVDGKCKVNNTINNNSYCLQTLYASNTTYYTRVEHEIISNRIWYSTTGTNNYGSNDKRYHSHLGTPIQNYFVAGRYSSQFISEAYIDNVYVINLTALNIQPTKDDLDFYYSVYFHLKSLEETYDNGYDYGYDDGNLDGFYAGYDDGLFDYHTGNNYGSYDYTLSDAYNQATQANVSLLNIVSLIIGVVMSMIGFIINIDIFGISIASVLGTLAIGVGIIWLLKLIRG